MEDYVRLRFGGDHARRSWTAVAIADAIAPQIRADAAGGMRLPPAAMLAQQLALDLALVADAYRELVNRRLVVRRGRDHRVPGRRSRRLKRTPQPQLKPVIAANRPARGTPGFVTLSSAFLDPRLAPVREIARCMRRALRRPGLSHFAHIQGYAPLRALIARRLGAIGIATDPDHVLITVGSQQAVDIVARSLTRKVIATEDPAYAAAKALFALSDVRTVALPIDPFDGIDRPRWRAILARERPSLAYLTTRFQNPTGYSYASAELDDILAWSAELGFSILEDDWASEMLVADERTPTLRALGGSGVLYMNAFTKKTLPSLRVGYLVGDERSMPSLVQAKKLAINGFPSLVEEALFEFIDGGHYDAHLGRMRRELSARYRHCVTLLRAVMPDTVRWTMSGGGPVLWLELPAQVQLARLIADLRARKVLVNSPEAAFAGSPHRHGFMLGYGFPTPDEMTHAIEALGAVVSEQLRPRRRSEQRRRAP